MQCSDFYRLCTKQSWGFSGGSVVKILPDNAGDQETGFRSLGREDPLEKGMATCSSILAGKNPMERGARWATVHGVEKRQTQVSTHTVTRLHPLCHSLVKGSSHNWACTMQSYHNIIDYISCALHYIHVIYLFYNWWFMLLSPFHLFIHSPSSFPLATTSFFSVSVYFCFVLFFFFFNSICKWKHTVFGSLSDISLSIMPFRSIQVCCNKISFLFMTEQYSIVYHTGTCMLCA